MTSSHCANPRASILQCSQTRMCHPLPREAHRPQGTLKLTQKAPNLPPSSSQRVVLPVRPQGAARSRGMIRWWGCLLTPSLPHTGRKHWWSGRKVSPSLVTLTAPQYISIVIYLYLITYYFWQCFTQRKASPFYAAGVTVSVEHPCPATAPPTWAEGAPVSTSPRDAWLKQHHIQQ